MALVGSYKLNDQTVLVILRQQTLLLAFNSTGYMDFLQDSKEWTVQEVEAVNEELELVRQL